MKYVWIGPGTKVRVMFGCVALIAAMVFIDGLLNGQPLRSLAGSTSPVFRWSMVVLGALIGLAAFLGAYLMIAGSLETIESLMPTAAHGIRRAQARDSEMLERLGYAVLFAFCGGVALFTVWKRARTG